MREQSNERTTHLAAGKTLCVPQPDVNKTVQEFSVFEDNRSQMKQKKS